MGQKHKRFRESRIPLRDIRKNPRSMYARVPQTMAQFVLKIEKLSHIMGPTPILEMARAYGLRPRLWLLMISNIQSPMCFIIKTDLRLANKCDNAIDQSENEAEAETDAKAGKIHYKMTLRCWLNCFSTTERIKSKTNNQTNKQINNNNKVFCFVKNKKINYTVLIKSIFRRWSSRITVKLN